MTNAEYIRKRMETDKGLAEYFLLWDNEWGIYRCPDGETFDRDERDEALNHIVKWLNEESK